MYFAIRLSCILALLFCLASTGNAGAIDRDRQRLQELQRSSERNTDPNAQVEITYEAVELYKKYRGQENSDAAKESELNSQVNEFESKIELVEGVPKQGGGVGNFFKVLLGAAKKEIENLGGAKKDVKNPAQTTVKNIAKYLLENIFQELTN